MSMSFRQANVPTRAQALPIRNVAGGLLYFLPARLTPDTIRKTPFGHAILMVG